MSTPLHPVVPEARFGQLAVALSSGAGATDAVLAALVSQARLALRGLDARVQHDETGRLGRSAARLARRLAAAPEGFGGAGVPERAVIRLGIEMGLHLDPLGVATTVRRVRNGSAELAAFVTTNDDPEADRADAHATLFTQFALVAVIAQARLP